MLHENGQTRENEVVQIHVFSKDACICVKGWSGCKCSGNAIRSD